MTIDELRALQEPRGAVDQREHRSKLLVGEILLQQLHVTDIRFTRPKYAAYDILLRSGATTIAIEVKQRSDRFASTAFKDWWIEADKVASINQELSPTPRLSSMVVNHFSKDGAVLAWPLNGYDQIIEKAGVQSSARSPEVRTCKRFATYSTANAQCLKSRAQA